ncbi:MAG: mannose-1-phosphate guanylyltransferase, partial [Candidatus Binatia bacterium]
QRSSEALMVVAPADHIVTDQCGFQRTLLAACDLAATRQCLVTLGVRPTRPDTGFGYIEVGTAIGRGVANAHWVRRFREKPSAAIAGRYVATGRHLWNSGIFVWRAAVFRTALARTLPRVREALDGLWRGTERTVTRRLRRTYPGLPAISVDTGLMQPIATMRSAAPRVAVLRAGFDWNDVGSWSAMPEIWGCDQAGNTAVGKVLPVGASGSIVYSPERLVALVGTKDLIVVDSPDALLICARKHAQDVREITRALKRRRWTRYL